MLSAGVDQLLWQVRPKPSGCPTPTSWTTTYQQTRKCQKAFEEAKQRLTLAPVLAHYNPQLPVHLPGDASPYIGLELWYARWVGTFHYLCLLHIDSKQAKLCSSGKGGTIPHIQHYEIPPIFYGRHFTVIMDHKPLTTILGPKRGARMQCWALLLSTYSYDIRFQPTWSHGNADGHCRCALTPYWVRCCTTREEDNAFPERPAS